LVSTKQDVLDLWRVRGKLSIQVLLANVVLVAILLVNPSLTHWLSFTGWGTDSLVIGSSNKSPLIYFATPSASQTKPKRMLKH